MKSKKYFDKVANQWDKMRASFFSESLREKAFQRAELQKGKIATDIGAGTGFITEGLIQKELRVIAIDQSEAMLLEMKRKFQDVDIIDYLVGEAESLPIKDEITDYVFSNMLLHHVEYPGIAIKEMARILKPEGLLIITDLDEHNFKFLREEHHDFWMGFKREDIKRWLIESGLKDVKVECADENCCAQSSCGNNYANVSIFIAFGKK